MHLSQQKIHIAKPTSDEILQWLTWGHLPILIIRMCIQSLLGQKIWQNLKIVMTFNFYFTIGNATLRKIIWLQNFHNRFHNKNKYEKCFLCLNIFPVFETRVHTYTCTLFLSFFSISSNLVSLLDDLKSFSLSN